MGWPALSQEERAKRNAADEAVRQNAIRRVEKEVTRQRKERATHIVDDILKEIITVVIRPGPKQEERECTRVAEEMSGLRRALIKKVQNRLNT